MCVAKPVASPVCVTDTSDDGFDFQTFLRPLFRNGANSNLTRYASAVPWGEGEGTGREGKTRHPPVACAVPMCGA